MEREMKEIERKRGGNGKMLNMKIRNLYPNPTVSIKNFVKVYTYSRSLGLGKIHRPIIDFKENIKI